AATTVITAGGLIDDAIRASRPPQGLRRIRLDDLRFGHIFQVYGNDEAEAHDLLIPSVRERMLSLAEASPKAPRFLAEPGVFWAALRNYASENLFEPPNLAEPVDTGAGLAALSAEITSVLDLVDAVLKIDVRRPG
ncbi:MAG TPA: DUF3137 domain-containing protein, partial [Beijerinckiaceae bacterium]|nr:DUF3137 domain-containing protein [Beijerinckiaceae bacterium]